MSDPTSDHSENAVLLARLADEFAERYRRGERPSLTEYVERYPHLAADFASRSNRRFCFASRCGWTVSTFSAT